MFNNGHYRVFIYKAGEVINMTIGVIACCVGLLILWRVLAARRRAIDQLRTAHAEIRQQKQVQLAIEKRLAGQQKAEQNRRESGWEQRGLRFSAQLGAKAMWPQACN